MHVDLYAELFNVSYCMPLLSTKGTINRVPSSSTYEHVIVFVGVSLLDTKRVSGRVNVLTSVSTHSSSVNYAEGSHS